MTAARPGIAVIIPLFEGERWIAATLDSVLAQERPANEIVVVDDGSTDAGAEVVARYPGVRLLKNRRKGSTAARNFGLAETRSPHVAFLDHDDLWHPSHLRVLADLLADHPDASAAISECRWFQGTPPPWLDTEADAAFGIALKDIWELFPFTFGMACPGLGLMRRSVVEDAGCWDERFTGLADLNLWLRIATAGPFIAMARKTLAKRILEGSMLAKGHRDLPALLALRHRSMRAALDHRIARHDDPAETRKLERWFASLAPADALARCAKRGAWGEIGAPARALDAALAEEPADRVRSAILHVASPLSIRSEDYDQILRATLQQLACSWPPEATATKRALVSLMEAAP